ncbi:MAG: leucine--tRNA ligase [Microgenomates group bacterium]|nr:leucine--tRNA ligase [Microgenomates group bacterium]
MIAKYQPSHFEKKWIEVWEKDKVYQTPQITNKNKKNKIYVLDMFPYPSAAGLHVGHPRGYTASDILARYYRMNGWAVLHPMGWDAFGLPAENAAIKAKKNPLDMVPKNIANFRRQMKMLGFSYDWQREFSTTDPEYYQWTQWLFIQFFKMGLLYKKNAPINFCPFCKTGLAEEEVLADGTHERCGNKITKKELPQWIFAITQYADKLLEGLKGLDWPEGILAMQRNWIGKKEGININYKVKNSNEIITCFTTRPDTNFGATFIVLAPEHEFVKKIIKGEIKSKKTDVEKIKKYVEEAKAKTEIEREAEGRKKTGIFTGFYAVNNLNGRLLPVYISDFVLMNFGTGAVVGVPGHDKRDFEFAKKFGLEVIRVVKGKNGETGPIAKIEDVYEEDGEIINSEFLNGSKTKEAILKIIDYLEKKGWGKRAVIYHLRDWIFSRQRYWGEPIPMIYCESCAKKKISYWDTDEKIKNLKFKNKNLEKLFGWFPIKEQELPLKLPYIKSYQPTETGESPLSKVASFVKTTCPNCGGPAKRETDTMPNWAGSCWYFLAFPWWNKEGNFRHHDFSTASPPQSGGFPKRLSQNQVAPLIENWQSKIKNSGHWLPVDWYLGGAEHAVLHLLYARFWIKALYDIGLINIKEPFLRLRNVGMVLAEDHRKMSKSFGNVINPDEVVAEYGADALRMYEMFIAPFSQEISWSTKTLQGVYRFLKRVWEMYYKNYSSDKAERVSFKPSLRLNNKTLIDKLNKTIIKVGKDIQHIKMNTAIAAMMKFLNEWESAFAKASADKSIPSLSKENAKKFLQILAPFAPFLTEEIWREVLGEKTSIHLSSWPKAEEVEDEEIVIPVQVNGKLRGTIKVERRTYNVKREIEKIALENEKVKKYLQGKKYKMIYVEGKIVNFIII